MSKTIHIQTFGEGRERFKVWLDPLAVAFESLVITLEVEESRIEAQIRDYEQEIDELVAENMRLRSEETLLKQEIEILNKLKVKQEA